MNKIIKAVLFGDKAHKGQFRSHTKRVLLTVMSHPDATEDMIVAAALHDTVEDTPVTIEILAKEFGGNVAHIVDGLTNPSKGSGAPRDVRKAMDREHLAKAPWGVKLIKLADRLDNLKELHEDPTVPRDFFNLYRKESALLLYEALRGVDEKLFKAS